MSEELEPIQIQPELLSEEILMSVIEEFILREGTDYGQAETTAEVKAQQVLRQIMHNKVKIFFDPNTESVTLVNANISIK